MRLVMLGLDNGFVDVLPEETQQDEYSTAEHWHIHNMLALRNLPHTLLDENIILLTREKFLEITDPALIDMVKKAELERAGNCFERAEQTFNYKRQQVENTPKCEFVAIINRWS